MAFFVRKILEKTVKLLSAVFVLCVLAIAVACGGGSKSSATSGAISGNWEITMVRHNLATPFIYSGFLLQSGSTITGSVILNGGNGCSGVGPVSGTIDSQNLQLDINESGQEVSLTGALSQTGGAPSIAGQFSSVAGGCEDFTSTGTWTAVQIPPLTGTFHGSFSTTGNSATTIDVSGTLTQGPNIGASNAALSGTMTATSSTAFCAYLTTASVTGLISGTSVTLNLFGPDGSQIGQVPAPASPPATIAPDASSLTGSFTLAPISNSCGQLSGAAGALTLTFP
jgi:hypothetical protein